MSATPLYKITSCGGHAVTLDFGNIIDERINNYVLNLFHRLKQESIPGVLDIIPAYSSLTVVYDVLVIRKTAPDARSFIATQLENILGEGNNSLPGKEKLIRIPVCYEEAFAPDLQCLAEYNNTDAQSIPHIHCSKQYRVFMLGFLPGFAYMGTVEQTIAMPRKNSPRVKVPAGAVGIAGLQTSIYPLESPGGWNIIGQTPLRLFDAANAMATLLQPGNTVQFYPITATEFEEIKALQ